MLFCCRSLMASHTTFLAAEDIDGGGCGGTWTKTANCFFFSLSSYCSVAGRVVLPPLCTLLMSLFWWLVREEKWTVSYSLSGLPWPSEIVLNTRLVEECNSFTKLHVQGIYAWIKALRKKRKIYSFKNCWEKVNMQGVHIAIEGGGMEFKHVISSTSCLKEGAEFNHP